MSILTNAARLLSEPPGSFVYHLMSLLALEAALAMAIGHYRRTRDAGTGRMAVAAGLALAVRLAMAAITSLNAMGILSYDIAIPPLDRGASLVTFLLIGWALITRPGNNISNQVFVGVLIFVVVTAMVTLLMWQPAAMQSESYTEPLDAKLWQGLHLGALTTMMTYLAWRKPVQWEIGIALLTLPAMASGVYLYLSVVFPTLSANIPALNRIADLAALPMFAMIVYRRIIHSFIEEHARCSRSMTARAPDLHKNIGAPQPLTALQERLERLQKEWDVLEARMGELGDAKIEGKRGE